MTTSEIGARLVCADKLWPFTGTAVDIGPVMFSGPVSLPGFELFTGTGTTVDATPTTILTLPIAANTSWSLEFTAVAKTTDSAGCATVLRRHSVRRPTAGAVNIVAGITEVVLDAMAAVTGDSVVDPAPPSTNVLVNVTGLAATNISWSVAAKVVPV